MTNNETDFQEFRAKMKPTGAAARMNMARAGSMGSVNSNNSYEDTPRQDLQTTPVRHTQQRITNGGTGVISFFSVNFLDAVNIVKF